MNDRELLELAAKAYGAGQYPEIGDWEYFFERSVEIADEFKKWNPLEDDGDALRLAVKLSINFSVDAYPNHGWRQTEVCVGHKCEHKGVVKWLEHDIDEPWGDSPYFATRRAIVRAAAEIGKVMP